MDDSNIWQTGDEAIEGIFNSYFSNIFNSSNPSVAYIDKVIDKVNRKVTDDMNEF